MVPRGASLVEEWAHIAGEDPGESVTDVDIGAESRRQARAVPESAITEPLAHVISTDGFVPRLVALLSNALVWRESRELRATVGLGTNDWRVLAALGTSPGMSSSEVSDFLTVNKAVVSKSVNTLLDRGAIVMGEGPRGTRPLFLNAEGAQLHEVMRPISESGEEIILEGMTEDEVRGVTKTLQRMLERIRAAS